MASLYWIDDALRGLLPMLWMIIGIGLPWAYAILPTKHWQSRSIIAAIALAVGPAWITTWMLGLGVIGAQLDQRLFTPELILGGSLIIAAIGFLIAWQKRKNYVPKSVSLNPLAFDEKLIIGMIVAAVIIRWIHTAFWTFTAYDALWVYGFQGRLYFLEGFIPNSIDYYPQFVQLQYTYIQVLIGEINDHAARMVIPMMHIGSILAAYLLGERLFNRRTGLFIAALWSLHPYVGQWSFIGDLEIPLTFSFTMASTFFLRAWIEKDNQHDRRSYALLAGVMLGIAMYTKPTAGAFIWGVVLLVVLDLLRVKFRIQDWLPRFMVAFWAGLACIPLGAIWYLRNIALGHEAITFPPDFWLSFARRSADHLNWIVLAIIIGFAIYNILHKLPRRHILVGIIGMLILLIGILPSHPLISPARFDPPDSYISTIESLAIILGMLMIGASLYPSIRHTFHGEFSRNTKIVGWGLLLAAPYFGTWFYSYSYHYRLGFAIVPLLILPTAVILSQWFSVERIQNWASILRRSYYLLLLLLGIPGIIAVAVDVTWSRVWLTDPELDSDLKKYQVFNPSLMEAYYAVTEYIDKYEKQPIIVAPGEQRLHFFFPQMQIIDEPITTLNEFEAFNATHFLYGTQAQWLYERSGIQPTKTQIVSSFGRSRYFRETKYHTDATFSYEFYQQVAKEGRFSPPLTRDYPVVYTDTEIVFGDSLRFGAVGVSPEHMFRDENILFTTAWQALQSMSTDYEFVYELYNAETDTIGYQWFLHLAPGRHSYYATPLWDIGETVHDQQYLKVPDTSKIPSGNQYQIRIRVFNPQNGQFLPVYVDGEYVGDFYTIDGIFKFGRA